MYSITSRGLMLSHYGADLYGSFAHKGIGTVAYQAFLRGISADPHDGFFLDMRTFGVTFDSPVTGKSGGGDLRWKPISGLTVGTSIVKPSLSGTANIGPMKVTASPLVQSYAQYEHGIWTVSGEYQRVPVVAFGNPIDLRNWYGAVTAKAAKRLSLGSYYLQDFNRKAQLGPSRYAKELTVSARWDFNDFVYLKTEGHFVKGEGMDYLLVTNPTGYKPDAKLLAIKIGASF